LMEAMAREPKRYRKFLVASSMSLYGEGLYRCMTHGEQKPLPRSEERLARGEWEVPCPICGQPLEPILTREDKPPQYSSIYAITKKTQEEMALCFGRTYEIPTIALRFFNVFGSRQALSNPYTGWRRSSSLVSRTASRRSSSRTASRAAISFTSPTWPGRWYVRSRPNPMSSASSTSARAV